MHMQLIPVDGGPALDILKEITVVGRKEGCDLHLDHKSVSKMHCVLVKTDGVLFLRDLGSTNGTRVNGKRVRRAALMDNDQFAVASFGFRVNVSSDEPPPSPNERTMEMDFGEAANLLDDEKDLPDSDRPAKVQVKVNALPDEYPEDVRSQ